MDDFEDELAAVSGRSVERVADPGPAAGPAEDSAQ
jgi:hypothetical protein